tara:strand:+ start:33752 stop:34282 length:531 start_codon:yes stop_codon:yes gene_type:complete
MLNIIKHNTTPEDIRKGLQYHQPLIGNQAFLFTFPQSTTSGFWNKNVSFPIDVAFFDKNKYLINIEHLDKEQLLDVKADRPFKYVVETRKGWFSENNIKKGDSLDMLLKLGFKKTAEYDPTVEQNTQEVNPLFKQVKNIPTSHAIDALANQWMHRKPAQKPYLKARKMVKDYNEIK